MIPFDARRGADGTDAGMIPSDSRGVAWNATPRI